MSVGADKKGMSQPNGLHAYGRSATGVSATAAGSARLAAWRRAGLRSLLFGALVLGMAGCAGDGDVVPPLGGSGVASPPSTAASDVGGADSAAADTEDGNFEPAYDVFLAAVAEAVADTRYVDVPFDEPEITAATGLAICEAMAAGEPPDQVIAEFAADLSGGGTDLPDHDQVRLTGAILGAAEAALCPSDV